MNGRNGIIIRCPGIARAVLLAGCLGVLLTSVSCVSHMRTGQKAIVIRNVTPIDAVNGTRAPQDILLLNNGISMTGDIKSGEYGGIHPDNITFIDATGKYLIPGLWDAHVHLSYTPGLDYKTFFPLSIAHGVTSLRDTGGHLEKLATARTVSRTDPAAPDLYVSGPLLDGINRVYDGHSAAYPDLSVGLDSVEEAVLLVDQLALAEVNFVKAYEMLKPEVFAAITKRAAEHGLPVAAHAPLSMTAKQAADLGADDMQHLRNLELACADHPSELLGERKKQLSSTRSSPAGSLRSRIHKSQRAIALETQNPTICDDLIKTLASNKVYQTPTLTIVRFAVNRLYAQRRWQQSYAMVPPSIGDGWLERSRKLSERQPDEDTIKYDQWILSMIPRLQSAGVPIMAGTDAPIAFLTPGASLHEELALLVEAGLTPLQALGAATITPAAFFGLEGQQGTIDAGMKADLVLLNKNPLENIRHVGDIHAVIKNGMLLDREKLDLLLADPIKTIQ